MTERSAPAPQGAAASLLNGLNVLEAFTPAHPVLGVTEISDRVGLHKSTVSRMLQGFAEAGYVQRDETTGRYRLGLGLLGLAAPLLADLDVRRAALPHLEHLTEVTGETSGLSLWNGTEAVVVEQVDSPHQVKHSAHIGTRYNRWASSSVRLFLSSMDLDHVHSLVESGHIIVSEQDRQDGGFDSPEEHLRQVQNDELAINDGQTTYEEFGVSTAIRDYRGRIAGCITVSAPRSRVQHLKLKDLLISSVRDTAKAVSARLGDEA
ncbi:MULTISPECIES: IclR family transcriptional regulator [Citricoccus]|uniref:IclR family transcriptional regulator n=1 Tax=Citricoccus muralis TaxID=169134 RepID=A0ABY8H5P3_9MICC|nr:MULTISPECIES: IclR family transcriptional regulator [Citricoccus]WBL20127.1 IclR family transcriptional regulator [Citricoccus sp. NR2]WFP16351.1 IclR family transcriptional regulator [Citricoccus muralis]